jgi:hypothetical protein
MTGGGLVTTRAFDQSDPDGLAGLQPPWLVRDNDLHGLPDRFYHLLCAWQSMFHCLDLTIRTRTLRLTSGHGRLRCGEETRCFVVWMALLSKGARSLMPKEPTGGLKMF